MVGLSRKNAGPSSGHGHEHEWRVPEDDSAFEYEDGGLYIYQYCDYAEVTGSATSDRLDETFYEYGYECEASRTYRFDLVKVEMLGEEVSEDYTGQKMRPVLPLADGRDELRELYDESPMLVEKLEEQAAERLLGTSEEVDEPQALDACGIEQVFTDDIHVTVEHGGNEHRLTYEHTDTNEL